MSKLEDTETIIPALKGILAITRIPTLSPDNVIDICAALAMLFWIFYARLTHVQDLRSCENASTGPGATSHRTLYL